MYERAINLPQLLRNRSVFLFGPRQTGKSTLLHHLFPDAVFFDLLEADTFRELSARPEYMRQTLPPAARLVFLLSQVEGYRHAELAELLGIAEGTSKAHLHHARKQLRKELGR